MTAGKNANGEKRKFSKAGIAWSVIWSWKRQRHVERFDVVGGWGGCVVGRTKGALTNYEGRGESRAVAMDGIPGDLGRGDEIKPPSQKPWFRRGRGIYYPRELGRGGRGVERRRKGSLWIANFASGTVLSHSVMFFRFSCVIMAAGTITRLCFSISFLPSFFFITFLLLTFWGQLAK